MPSFNCKDMGFDCSWSVKDKSKDGLMKKIENHAKKAHNITSMDESMKSKLNTVIKM